ncbi:conserved exported hypothetical protein [Moraxellaceae bacterium 17A]|nr:conserved exported hypothetical protein [Moraxellaceae bacterium 17A]
MRKIFSIFVLSFLSVAVFAAPTNTDKQQALNKALAFGNSMHCQGTPFSTTNPLKSVFVIDDNDDGSEIRTYAVLQSVDLNCGGGSGTGSFILTPVQQQGSRFYVDKEQSEDGNLFDQVADENFNPRFIEQVNYDPYSKKLNLITLGYAENDGNANPSQKWKYVISLDSMMVESSKLLGNN